LLEEAQKVATRTNLFYESYFVPLGRNSKHPA